VGGHAAGDQIACPTRFFSGAGRRKVEFLKLLPLGRGSALGFSVNGDEKRA
jgi:hypothetical protein